MRTLQKILLLGFIFISFSNYTLNSQTLWVCGENGQGEFGNGTIGIYSANWIMVGADTNWKEVSCGDAFTIALKQDGTLWASGNNYYGPLGIGTNTGTSTFTQIGADSDWKKVNCGYSFAIVQKQDGTLWSWGLNDKGQLGHGTNINKNIPTKISSDKDWKMVSCGDYFTLALKNDGSLWSWGGGDDGQLGDGTNTNRNTPLRIGTDNDWKTIACGAVHSIALKQDGSFWAWGNNEVGELGDGTKIRKNNPIRVGSGNDWDKIFGGVFFTMAIKQDGSLWAWGSNYFGKLGDGTQIDRLTPIRIGIYSDWDNVYNSWDERNHTLAIKKDGILWGWGNNNWGQLGNGTQASYSSPKLISNEINWLSLACGWDFSVALRSTSSFVMNSSAILQDTSIYLKESICIPLHLSFQKITPAEQKKGTFSVSLEYNSLALRYFDGIGTKYKANVSTLNNRETLTITSDTIIFTGKDTLTLNLCFKTYLSDSLENKIIIKDFDFTGKNSAITQGGTISYLGCRLDLRKVIFVKLLDLLISPNPVGNKLNLKYSNEYENTPLKIISIIGISQIETNLSKEIDVSSLSSGLYFININNQLYKFLKE